MNKGSYTYYDLIGHLVPGILFLGFLLVVAKWLGWTNSLATLSFAEALGFGSVIAYIIGLLLQGVSSWFEPILHRMWGGMPSIITIKKALNDEDKTTTKCVYVQLLAKHFSVESPEKNPQLLFMHAKDLVNRKALGRTELFNSMYALCRAMFTVTTLVSILSLFFLIVDRMEWWNSLDWEPFWSVTFLGAISLTIMFYRIARDKAYDYVNEVISMAGNYVLEES